jgi:hypothetical protein
MPEISGYTAKHVEARRDFRYTNHLAPLSKWTFRLRLPDGSAAQFEVKIMDHKVAGHVDELSDALRGVAQVVDKLDRIPGAPQGT